MPKHVLRNTDVSEFDLVELEREGLLKPNGRTKITQKAIAAFRAAQDEADRLAAVIRRALLTGCAVEDGDLSVGLFVEQERRPNWRAEFVALGGDAADVNARTPKVDSAPRLRTWGPDEAVPKGRSVAPTANGEPVVGGRAADNEEAEAA